MRILLTNDDGIGAIGLMALVKRLAPKHELFVSAPDGQRSAVSKSLTLYTPLRAERRTLEDYPAVTAYAVSGTPVDCVRLALGNLMPVQPDVCISGINIGHNLGTDTLYSGTCAGANEAAIRNIPAIAMSCCSFHPEYMATAAQVAEEMLTFLERHPLPFGSFYNVNVPDKPYAELKGIRRACLGILEYETEYVERVDSIGKPYYWAPRRKLKKLEMENTDEYWAEQGYVTLTPLTYNAQCPKAAEMDEFWELEG